LNYRVMFGWAGLIAVLTAVGLVTGFLGLLVAMPVLAFSTWHAYRDLIEPAPAIEEEAFPAAAI